MTKTPVHFAAKLLKRVLYIFVISTSQHPVLLSNLSCQCSFPSMPLKLLLVKISPNLVVTSQSTSPSTTQKHSTQWTTPSSLKENSRAFMKPPSPGSLLPYSHSLVSCWLLCCWWPLVFEGSGALSIPFPWKYHFQASDIKYHLFTDDSQICALRSRFKNLTAYLTLLLNVWQTSETVWAKQNSWCFLLSSCSSPGLSFLS